MANVVKVYNYDKNGYITAVGEMDLDIFEVVPISATIVQPSKNVEELAPNEELRFDEATEKWVIEINEDLQEPPSNYVTDERRIEELEMALADLMGGM